MKNKTVSIKIPKITISKFMIVIFSLYGLKIFHSFGNLSDKQLTVSIIVELLMVVFLTLDGFSIKSCLPRTRIIIAILMLGMVIASIRSNAGIKEMTVSFINYSIILLSVPMIHILKSGKWNFDSFIKCLVWLTVLAYLLRFFISYYEHFTGKMIFQGVYPETIAAGNWFRNGFMRINPPCFGNIIIPLAFYLQLNERTKIKRALYWVVMGIAVFYSYRIHAARSLTMYQSFELFALILLYRKKTINKLLVIMIAIVSIIGFFELGLFDKIVSMFALSNVYFGYSNYSRLLSLAHFGNMYLKHPITGIGYLPAKEMRFLNYNYNGKYLLEGGHLSDIGVMYSIVQLGVAAILFYILFFEYGYKAGKMQRSLRNNNLDILAWGIILSVAITGINIDLFYSVYLFSAPFCLTIIDWIYSNAETTREDAFIREKNRNYPLDYSAKVQKEA